MRVFTVCIQIDIISKIYKTFMTTFEAEILIKALNVQPLPKKTDVL